MLGFKEIGQLSDSIESVFEELKNGKITDVPGFCASMTEAINIVKNLSIGEEVNAADLAKITAILDNKDFPEVEEAAEETLEEESAQTSREDGRFKDVFIEEASDLMEQLNADALKLEKKPGDASVLNNILRNLHTLKGSALMSGYEKIGELSHKLEDYLEIYGAKDNKQKAAMLDPLFDVLDILQDMLDSLAQEGGTEMIPHLMTRLAAIDNQIFQIQDKSIAKDSEAGVVKPALKPIQTVTKDGENVVKVSTAYLDALVNMSTELVVNRTELSSHIEKLKELIEDADLSKRQIRKIENKIDELFTDKEGSVQGEESEGLESPRDEFSENLREFTGKVNNIIKGLNKLSEELDRDVNRIDTVSKVLHHDILKARMVPISTLFARYPKAVRDLARKQGKKINLNISDNNAELDRAMVSALSDPILHILRNAVDHGIETPEERAELNKGEEANIAIIARQEKSQVIIDIIDDGRGIDIDKIKETIIKNDLASAGEVAKMSEAEVLDYIFHSGFSTKDSISNVSGRGIGLDVVASQIQKLKGNIRVRTEKNIGTTFSLRVPLTLTISQALLIRSQGQILALPIFAVKETIEFAEDSIVEEEGKKFIKVRGSLLPYVQLDELLKFGQAGESEKVSKVLVISDAGINIALGVTEVINRQEIVIKTLGSLLQNIDYISGGTILGNGEVCLILDYALIVRTVEVHTIGGETDVYALKSERKTLRKKKKKSAVKKKAAQIKLKKISGRKPRIMIVDDSRSVLNFVSAILDDNNMEPIKSSSGIEALEQIDENDVDLLITDLEMPKMHGFELVQSIRKNNKFDQLPIIILTGRDTKADREKAKEYGANAFINKPFKERDLLKVMEQFIQIVK
jgi:chemotaxis protein histidine kinase CheA/ActR/RegA family two-component response regulator